MPRFHQHIGAFLLRHAFVRSTGFAERDDDGAPERRAERAGRVADPLGDQVRLHRIPEGTRVLSLEDRTDPVALLGSLINARVTNRLTVVFDGGDEPGAASYVAGGRAADAAGNRAPGHDDHR